MFFASLQTGITRLHEFVDAEPSQQAAWLMLLLRSCEEENGGVIAGCKGWSERMWLTNYGVMKADIDRACGLYWFNGDDLCLFDYPLEMEQEQQEKRGLRAATARANGARGGRPKGSFKKPSGNQDETQQEPDNNPDETEHKPSVNPALENSENKNPTKPSKEVKSKEVIKNSSAGGEFNGGYVPSAARSRPARKYGDRELVVFVRRLVSINPSWGKTKLNGFEYRAAEMAFAGLKMSPEDFDLLHAYLNSNDAKDKRNVPFLRPLKREKLFENLGDWLAHADRWAKESRWGKSPFHKSSNAENADPKPEEMATDEDIARFREEMGMPAKPPTNNLKK